MSDEKVGYARREFLGQCLAAPVAAQAVLSGSDLIASDTPSTVAPPVAAPAPVYLEREVESLLKLVDLQVVYRRVPVPAEKNAWPLWKQAHESYVSEPENEDFGEMTNRLLDSGTFPTGELRNHLIDWIDKNAECRRLMDEGIKIGAMELPRSSKDIRLSLAMDEMTVFRRLAELRALTSRVAIEKGDLKRGASEAFANTEFAKILLAAECMIIDFLVGIAALGIGITAVRQLAVTDGVPETLARESIERLAACKVSMESFKQAYRVEYCRYLLPYVAGFPNQGTMTEVAQHYVHGLTDPSPGFKPTEKGKAENDRAIRDVSSLLDGHKNPLDKVATARLGSDLHMRLFAEVDKDSRERTDIVKELQQELADWPDEVEPDIWVVFGLGPDPDRKRVLTHDELVRARNRLRRVDNPLGKRIVSQALKSVVSIVIERNHARVDSARLQIALRLYERKHGRLPEALAALVDDGLLSDVPKDPFDAKEFKYSRDRRVIWSIGTEGTNDGVIPEPGDPQEQFNEGLEMTWRI